jgi:phosphoglycerate dehydrogenase-like enzyme
MDEERRAALAVVPRDAFDPVIFEDLSPPAREAAWSEADVVVCLGFRSEFPRGLARRAPRLRMVQTLVAGVDHIPFDRIPAKAIVCSNAGAYSVSVAEHAFALLLAAAKDIPKESEEIRRGIFEQDVEHKLLRGSTLLVVGLGGIGREVARLGRAFGMRVLGIRRHAAKSKDADEVGMLADLEAFARQADSIVLALPLTRETEGLVDAAVLRAMRDDAVLVNVGRGKLIAEDELYEHLRSHPRFRAALDVWWTYPDGKEGRPFHRPFHELDNVVMTPHVAPSVPGQRRAAMEAGLANVLRFLRGDPPERVVDRREYPKGSAP